MEMLAVGEFISFPPSVLALRLALGGTLLIAAFGKLRDQRGFASGLADYRLFPSVLLHPLAWIVPLTELVVAAALLLVGYRAHTLCHWPLLVDASIHRHT